MISLTSISKQYGSKVLFEEADARIDARSRMALIGPNGAGKSTLIRIVLGQEQPDQGVVSKSRGLMIGYLAQEVPKLSDRTVLEETMRLDGRREQILATRSELETRFESGQSSDEDLERYGRILEELEHLDEYRLESRAQAILMGMGFSERDFGRNLSELSGGWLMRVALARILLLDPDLLLLDEPTNHLDLESLLWLEEFLKNFRGAVLLVSHDTEFLNRVVTEVVDIDQHKLVRYRGNLDAYRIQKSERMAVLRAQYQGQQSRIQEIEDFVERFGAKATKARQAQSRLKELEKMERIELPEERDKVRFRFPPAPHSGREVITLKRATLSYPSKRVFDRLEWTLMRGSRVAIVGVNGAGKTTLLKLLSVEMAPTEGGCIVGHAVKVGYYAQHQAEQLNFQKTVLQELEAAAPDLPVSRVRGIAGAFLFTGDAVDKKCGVLSGGEKARVALAKLLLSPSNFLILDEPTNHLDVDSREVLLEALQNYEGTLCIVSHDRAFIGPLVTSVLEIVPAPEGSRVIPLLGSYDDYLSRKIREAQLSSSKLRELEAKSKSVAHESNRLKASHVSDASTLQSKPSNNQIRTWERMRDRLEAEITASESQIAECNRVLEDPKTYENQALTLEWVEKRTKIERSLNEKLSEWEGVSAKLSQR